MFSLSRVAARNPHFSRQKEAAHTMTTQQIGTTDGEDQVVDGTGTGPEDEVETQDEGAGDTGNDTPEGGDDGSGDEGDGETETGGEAGGGDAN